MDRKEQVRNVVGASARVGNFLGRRKRLGIALPLIVPPALTGSIELFVLNLLGLGVGALFVRNQLGRRREARAHRLWLERRAEREEWEHQRWLKRREREANQTPG